MASNLVVGDAKGAEKSPQITTVSFRNEAHRFSKAGQDAEPSPVLQAVLYLNELGLIYSEPLPRINADDTWRTDHTIFCNAYKREGGYLLASGRDYYESEIKNKKKKLKCIRGKYEGGSSHD